MYVGAWYVLTLLGILTSGTTTYLAARNTSDDDAAVIITGALGFVIWAIWTYGSLYLETPVQNNNTLSFSEPELAVGVGLPLAVASLFLALTGPIELVSRYRDGDPRDL